MPRKLSKGVPSAEEEALQEPEIDPVSLLASMGMGGLANNAEKYALETTIPKDISFDEFKALFDRKNWARTPALLNAVKGAGNNAIGYLRNILVNNLIAPNASQETKNLTAMPPAWNVGQVPTGLVNQFRQVTRDGKEIQLAPPWLQSLMFLGLLGTQAYSSSRNKKKQ